MGIFFLIVLVITVLIFKDKILAPVNKKTQYVILRQTGSEGNMEQLTAFSLYAYSQNGEFICRGIFRIDKKGKWRQIKVSRHATKSLINYFKNYDLEHSENHLKQMYEAITETGFDKYISQFISYKKLEF